MGIDHRFLETTQVLENQAPSSPATAHLGESNAHVRRIRQVTQSVFGGTSVSHEVDELCRDHIAARNAIQQDRTPGSTVIAMVGATGQGKSWLVKQLIHSEPVIERIRSGNNSQDATEKLLWIGPSPPADLDPRTESYLACPKEKMQSIGIPYVLVDTPGSTDDRHTIASSASRALSMASVLVMVVRRDQLRSHAVSVLNQAAEGTLIIPVINAIRNLDADTNADVDAFVARMRSSAPSSQISQPVLIEDYAVGDQKETQTGSDAATALASRLQDALQQDWDGDRRKSTRLAALDMRFSAALRSLLHDQLPNLADAVQLLHAETHRIPGEVAESLLGGGGSLRGAIRSRLRLGLMEDTPALFFPFRSLLGLLNLTAGAWDRLLLSLSGSLPSLIGTVWSGAKNLASQRDSATTIREGLRIRSSAAVDERLRPLARDFRDELAKLRQPGSEVSLEIQAKEDNARVACLTGLDTLQERSQLLFETITANSMLARPMVWLGGCIGTLIFWGLMSGPIVALYRDYLGASVEVLGQEAGLERFPHPSAGMLLTSLLLSLLPTAIFAMWLVTFAQSRRRVRGVEEALREQHHQTIQQLQRDGILRLRWDDPMLADAEFLLSVGAQQETTSSVSATPT